MTSKAKVCASAALVCLLLGATTAAQAAPKSCGLTESRCDAKKYACVAKLKSCLLACYSRALNRKFALEAACVGSCRTKFSNSTTNGGCIERVDAHEDDCRTSGDGPALRAKVDAHVLEIADRLVPGGGGVLRNRCTADKFECLGDYDACILSKLAYAVRFGGCAGYASCDKYLRGANSCFEKLELHHRPTGANPCLTFDDQTALKVVDDLFVNDLIDSISGRGVDLHSRRCTNDTSITCTSDAPCLGGGGTCQFYFGAPLPLSAGGTSTCVTNQWSGTVSGTFDAETGASAGSAKLLRRAYLSPTVPEPCPRCVGASDFPNDGVFSGTCSYGIRAGLTCDGNGESPVPSFGVTSLDCPPNTGTLVQTSLVDLANTNDGATTATVTAGSPTCNGQPGKTCLCGSCSGDAQIACKNDGECALAGAGTCTNAFGRARRVNECLDDTSSAADETICAPLDGDDGACPFAPVDQHCSIEVFRGCLTNSDCPATDDRCISTARRCYPGYDGNVGDTVAATGRHAAPIAHTGTATVASVFCVAPSFSAAVNFGFGLPGPGRAVLSGVTANDGSASTCPSHMTFLPTAKGGAWDVGWTGLGFGLPSVGQGKVTVGVVGCANPTPPCGVCSYVGPVENVNADP